MLASIPKRSGYAATTDAAKSLYLRAVSARGCIGKDRSCIGMR